MTNQNSENTGFLTKLTEITEANITSEQFGVSELAKEMGMSRSNLHRKVILATKTSVSQFIRQYRLKRAMEMLRQTSATVSEVAYKVGFGSVTYFTKCFGDYYGFPPGEVGKRNIAETITEVPARKKTKKLIPVILIMGVIIPAIVLFVVINPFKNTKKSLEKSIAILPFIDDSPDEGNTYIINGIREEILNKLEKIDDFKVVSRTTSENYKGSTKSIHDIAEELHVNYILEGSGQKIGNRIKITLQLIEAETDKHLWSHPYMKEVGEDKIFELQDDVAFAVTMELKAILSQEEKEQIIRKPTENLAAYNLYLRGLEHINIANTGGDYRNETLKAKKLFEEAIKQDTTFADAYNRLGLIYIDMLVPNPDIDLSEQFLDSGLTMVNKAMFHNGNAFLNLPLKTNYYLRKGMFKEARDNFEKYSANKIKDDSFYGQAFRFYVGLEDNYKTVESFYKFIELKPKESLVDPWILGLLSTKLNSLGYAEIGKKYWKEYLIQTNDSAVYFYFLAEGQLWAGNIKASIDYCLKADKIDSGGSLGSLLSMEYLLLSDYIYLRDYSKANKYIQIIENNHKNSGSKIPPDLRLGYLYLKNGQLKEADYHFAGVEKYCLKIIELNRPEAQNFDSQLWLASIYAIRGEKEKAMEYLGLQQKRKTNPVWLVNYLKLSPILDNIRNEPEFTNVIKDVEAKYQEEHERVGELLKEYGEIN